MASEVIDIPAGVTGGPGELHPGDRILATLTSVPSRDDRPFVTMAADQTQTGPALSGSGNGFANLNTGNGQDNSQSAATGKDTPVVGARGRSGERRGWGGSPCLQRGHRRPRRQHPACRQSILPGIGMAKFSNQAGTVQGTFAGGRTLPMGDVNGDGIADFAPEIHGTALLSARDLLL